MATETKDLLIRIKGDSSEIERILKRVENRTGQAVVNQVDKALKNIYKKEQELSDKFKRPWESKVSYGNYFERENVRNIIEEKVPKLKGYLQQQRWEETKRGVRDSFVGAVGGVAIGKTLTTPIQAAIDFEKSLTNTAKVYNLTKKEMQDFGRELLNLSKIMPVPTDQLGALSYQMAQLGLNQKELMPALQLAVKAGMGLDIPLNEVGQKIGGLKAAFGISMDRLQGALDFINEASNKISATPADILSATTRIAPLAASEKLTPEQTATLASVLLNAQWQPETVETGIKDFIVGLTNMYSTGSNSAKFRAIQKLGMDRSTFEKYLKQDFIKSIEYFLTSARAAGQRGERIDTLMYEIFGQQHFSKLLTILGEGGWGKFQELMTMYNKRSYTGSLEQEYQRVLSTTASAMTVLQNNFKALQITAGDTLLPTVKQVFTDVSSLFSMIQEFTSDNALGKYLVSVGTSLGVIAAVLGVVMPTMKLGKYVLGAIYGIGGGGKFGAFALHIAGAVALKEALEALGSENGILNTVMATLGTFAASTLGRRFIGKQTWTQAAKSSVGTSLTAGGVVAGLSYLERNKDPEGQKQLDARFNQMVSNTSQTNTSNIDNSKQTEYNTTNIYNDNRNIVINNPTPGELQNFNELVFNERPKGFD